jgi:hypothetical protein
MPPFRSLFVIILLNAAPPMERITNQDNHGHMISSAQACITAKHAKAAGALLARHFPPSQGTELFATFLPFFSRVGKALKIKRSPNCGGMCNALRSLFFWASAGGICRTSSRYGTLTVFAGCAAEPQPAPLPEVAIWVT